MIVALARKLQESRLQGKLRRSGAILAGGPLLRGRPLPIIRNSGTLRLGSEVMFRTNEGPPILDVEPGGTLEIGDECFINAGVEISCVKSIVIGRDTLIAHNVYITDNNRHEVSEGAGVSEKPVTIGRNVWLGRGVIVLPGASIGDHSVIAAGVVVREAVPARTMYKGPGDSFPIEASDTYKRR